MEKERFDIKKYRAKIRHMKYMIKSGRHDVSTVESGEWSYFGVTYDYKTKCFSMCMLL